MTINFTPATLDSLKATQTGKDILKRINKMSYVDIEDLNRNTESYINAIAENRMFCVIHSVSSSGMNRNLSFLSFNVADNRGSLRNYHTLFELLGYKEGKEGFKISGCGMDMVFATNYNNIRDFERLGMISKEDSKRLQQMTPNRL